MNLFVKKISSYYSFMAASQEFLVADTFASLMFSPDIDILQMDINAYLHSNTENQTQTMLIEY